MSPLRPLSLVRSVMAATAFAFLLFVPAQPAQAQESIADLVKLLNDPNPPVRAAALQLMTDLGRTASDRFRDREVEILKGLREAGPAVAKLASDNDANVRRAAAEALGSIRADLTNNDIRAAWERVVSDKNEDVQLAATRALAEHTDRGLERIRATLMPEPRVALTAEFFIDANAKLPLMAAAYRQRSEAVQVQAFQSFQHLLNSIPNIPILPLEARKFAGFDALVKNLKDLADRVGKTIGDIDVALKGQNPHIRVAAAGVIEEMIRSRLRDWLLQPTLQPEGRAAVTALAEGVKQAIPSLERSVGDPNPDVRRACLYALEALGPAAGSARGVLLAALRDPDPFVRWAAARALGRAGPDDNPKLTQQLALGLGERMDDEDIDVRLAAANSLEYFGEAALPAVPALARVFVPKERMNSKLPGYQWPPAFVNQPPQIPDRTLELAVAQSLRTIADRTKQDLPAEALPLLLQGLASEEDRVRRILPTLTPRFGAESKKAVPALEVMLKVDDDLEARENAAKAIIRILGK